MIPLPQNHPLHVQYDWKAYFAAFQEEHGQGLEYKGRLLFQDGWMYSRTDYSGPEYMPPKDPEKLKRLKRDYWLMRWDNARAEAIMVNNAITALVDAQRHRSAQVMVTHTLPNENGILKKGKPEPLDTTYLEERREYLIDELATCEAQLILIDPTYQGRRPHLPDGETAQLIRTVISKASQGVR